MTSLRPLQRSPIKRKVGLSRSRLKPISAKQRRRNDVWAEAKREAFKSCKGRCMARVPNVCTGAAEHPHHRKPRARGGEDTAANCLWCCSDCHRWAHEHDEAATALGLMEASYEH